MLRALLFVGLAIGMSLLAAGCGGGTTADPGAILIEFQQDGKAASQKYQGKTVRLSVEKVTAANKNTVKGVEHVTVQGQVAVQGPFSMVMIDATVTDPAQQQKALALKIGEPATFEGEPAGGIGEKRGSGAAFSEVGEGRIRVVAFPGTKEGHRGWVAVGR